jgi:hypothetical protein
MFRLPARAEVPAVAADLGDGCYRVSTTDPTLALHELTK